MSLGTTFQPTAALLTLFLNGLWFPLRAGSLSQGLCEGLWFPHCALEWGLQLSSVGVPGNEELAGASDVADRRCFTVWGLAAASCFV